MQIHVVKRGESLWSIAARYGVRISQIVNANGLPNGDQLVPGEALLVPVGYPEYTVQVGDSLYLIARRYGTTTEALAGINRIANAANITPGQRLTIPVLVYTVVPGDTLWQIAAKFRTTIGAIVSANQLQDASQIYVGQPLRIPRPPRPTIDVNAFTTVFGEAGASTVAEVAEYLTYLCPFGYRIQSDGGLTPVDDTAQLEVAKAGNVVSMMAITNFSSTETGTALAHTVLSNPSIQDTLLTNIIQTMNQKGYLGLNIDFENVSPEDKDLYNQFLERTVNRLHPQGYFVSSSLAPKTSANQKGLLYEAHDYPAHGRILDFVVLMTYEWGYRLGPPQAISPLDQIKRVLDYAVSAIPRNKILMGFQLYARDWLLPHVQGMQAETFDMQEAIRRAVTYGATIRYDKTAQSPYYNYTDEQGRGHEVWFEDARSAVAKLDLIQAYNLRGVSYWVLGYPFPQNWVLLADSYVTRKL
ncbi:LysM peptidoglycan-binding domain-containing protein [Alicyclobacillus curvatus]|nr:LysM peptidoglycan-binding domain-containing protein [Alicyclobacillus curvatus]